MQQDRWQVLGHPLAEAAQQVLGSRPQLRRDRVHGAAPAFQLAGGVQRRGEVERQAGEVDAVQPAQHPGQLDHA